MFDLFKTIRRKNRTTVCLWSSNSDSMFVWEEFNPACVHERLGLAGMGQSLLGSGVLSEQYEQRHNLDSLLVYTPDL